MRKLAKYEKQEIPRVDLVVSELLGSFADNEMSPECLNEIQAIFHTNTICIPQSYRNFIGI